MPLQGEAKRVYQREYMRARRRAVRPVADVRPPDVRPVRPVIHAKVEGRQLLDPVRPPDGKVVRPDVRPDVRPTPRPFSPAPKPSVRPC